MKRHTHQTTAAAPGEGTRPTTAPIPESINPFNAETEPVQFERFEKIVAAVQAGKTDAEICAEFSTGPKSVAEIREKLGTGKKEPGAETAPADATLPPVIPPAMTETQA